MKFRQYIWGTKIVVKTDHRTLCWLMTKQELSGRHERWSLSLQEYDTSIHYKKGSLHEDADALSRYPIQERGEEEQVVVIPVTAIGLDTLSWADGQNRVKQWRWIKQVMIKNGSTQYENFMLKEGLLYLRTIRFGQEFDRLCVPSERRKEALSWVHDEPTAGHLGQTKTLKRARKRFYWPKMDRAVTRYVQSCKSCQTRKPDQGKKKGLMEITQVGDPSSVSALMSLARSRDHEKGTQTSLWRWTVYEMGRSQRLAGCYGPTNRKILRRGRSVPYHQQANGLVERQHKMLATMLAMYVDKSHEDWDEVLGFVIFAYNTARKESTNHTPFMVVYGREAVIPADLLAATGLSQPKLVGAEDLMKVMMELREDVKDWLAIVQQRQKTQYDARRKKGLAEKLLHQYVGPYEVIRQVTELNYELRKPSGKKTLVVNVSQMKKFVVEADEDSDSDEEVEKLENLDIDLDVERTDTDLNVECADADSGVARAATGSDEARAETEEGKACAETDTGETPEANTGVPPDTSTASAAVEPPARREKGRISDWPLELVAEMDEGLQDGKVSAVLSATKSPVGRPTRKKRAPGRMKNMLFFTLVCVVGQMVQANEMRGNSPGTEEVTLFIVSTMI
ncbi:Uncharacterized protein APZ42_030038 [Daphnia magna]|uniref:RNA-directed DNA polymerase n=1 Tax=Daphnia magna TaxID=35525 RepID=A0A164P3Z1_9CRUS|nr:Uncharacterized protein APZ42_030038 [Daphnia magna]